MRQIINKIIKFVLHIIILILHSIYNVDIHDIQYT